MTIDIWSPPPTYHGVLRVRLFNDLVNDKNIMLQFLGNLQKNVVKYTVHIFLNTCFNPEARGYFRRLKDPLKEFFH